MAFTEDVVRNAFEKVNGYCQICGKKLIYANRGNALGRGGWDAKHIKPVSEGGKDEVRNCMILCMDCMEKLGSSTPEKTPPGSVDILSFSERRKLL